MSKESLLKKPLLNYETLGNPSSPALLMLHGILSSNYQWDLNKAELSGSYFLVMVELWGHGGSPAPEEPSAYRPECYVDELEAIRNTLNIDQWCVIGQSYGGAVAMQYALAAPQTVLKLVITNSSAGLTAMPNGKPDNYPEDAFNDTRALPMHPINAKRLDPEVKAKFVEIADKTRSISVLNTFNEVYEMNSHDRVGELSMPVMLAHGIYEKKFQPIVDWLGDNHPSLKIAPLEAGHSVNVDAPEQFNQLIFEFIGR